MRGDPPGGLGFLRRTVRTVTTWPYPFRRFFARVIVAELACPDCGRMIKFGAGPTGGGEWDRIASLLVCGRCRLRMQVGLVAWRAPAKRQPGKPVPEDQRPDVREQAELRTLAGGFFPGGKIAEVDGEEAGREYRDPVNRWIDGECCCEPWPWRAECPVHGEGTKEG